MVDIAKSPVAIDLFSGAGGLSEGLLAAGINVAVAVENHPHPALTHAFNHPGTTVLCGDICKLPLDYLADCLIERTGHKKVDLIAGGPPCQGFSPAGKQDPDDPRNNLFLEFIRVIDHFRPKMFLFENVPAFSQIHDCKVIHNILDALWELGYKIYGIDNESEYYPETYPVLNSVWYGVPQRRRRLILIGWLDDAPIQPFSWPCVTHSFDEIQDELVPFLSLDKRSPNITVEEAIGDLAYLSGGLECHAATKATSSYQKQRSLNSKLMFNHLATKHRKETVNMFRRLGSGKTIRSIPEQFRSGKQRMRRFSNDESSFAILGLPDDYVHYKRHRIPTVREMARLQSFDDDYVFFGKRTTSDKYRKVDVPQYTQVGNAVPPLLAKALGKSILRSLGCTQKDLRQINVRKQRHEWVLGSSGFNGYSLDPKAKDRISLYDMSGDRLTLPISEEESYVGHHSKSVDWTKRRYLQKAQNI